MTTSSKPVAVSRSAFLAPLIGEPWAWQSRNCWDLACHVQRELFGRELPHLSVPDGFSRRWVLDDFARHEERGRWRQVPDGPGGLVQAADGALVLMAYLRFPAHICVWLRPEQRIIHRPASPARRRWHCARSAGSS